MEPSGRQRVAGGSWFMAGAVILLLFGGTHSVAVLATTFAKLEPALDQLVEHEKSVVIFAAGPFTATAFGGSQILTMSYALLLLFAGAVDWLAMRPLDRAGRLRALIVLNILLTASLAAVSLAWQFPPPLVFAAAATICFVIAFLRHGAPAPEM